MTNGTGDVNDAFLDLPLRSDRHFSIYIFGMGSHVLEKERERAREREDFYNTDVTLWPMAKSVGL